MYQRGHSLDDSDDPPVYRKLTEDKRERPSYIGRRAADTVQLPDKRFERERVYIGKRTRSSPPLNQV